MTDLAVLHCRQLVTLAGPPGARSGPAMRSLAIIADGALHVCDGRIAAVGPRAEIERSFSADTEIVDAGGRIVLPGFIDAHTHPVFGRIRDYVDLVIHEMLPRVAREHLAEYCDIFCEPNVFPVEQARTVLRAARALGLGLRLHADQFSAP